MGASGTSSNTLTVTPAAGAPFVARRCRVQGTGVPVAWYYGVRAGWLPAATSGFGVEIEWTHAKAIAQIDPRASGAERLPAVARPQLPARQSGVSVLARAAAAVRARSSAAAPASRRLTSSRHSATCTRSSISAAGSPGSLVRGRSFRLAVRLRHRRRADHARDREASARPPAPRFPERSSRGTSISAWR